MPDPELQIPQEIARALQNNPELLKQLASPDFINSINDQLAKSPNLRSDWCVACGASRAAAPAESVINPELPLTADEIREIGKRLSSI